MPIDVKQAVDSAAGYFAKLMTVYDIRLEEVEMSDDERFWYVTLSGLVANPTIPDTQPALAALASLMKGPFERVYKIFTVDATSGSVRAMKIRELERLPR